MTTPSFSGLGDPLLRKFRVCGAVFCLVLLLFCGWRVPDLLAVVSNNVPLDDWSYGALDKLEGFGLIPSRLFGTKPYTRMEMARLVNEALRTKEEKDLKLPSLIEYYLERFQKEYKQELAVFGRGKGEKPAILEFKPLEEAKANYVYSNGSPEYYMSFGKTNPHSQYPTSAGGITATGGTPLLYNNEGIIYGEGSNFSLQFSSSFKFYEVFSGYVEPIFIVRQNDSAGLNLDNLSQGKMDGTLGAYGQTEVYVQKGYLKFSPWNVEIEAGRDSMYWGQGYSGTLILSNNAEPFNMLKLSNPETTILPWIFKYLGPFKYTIFCAQMEADRVPSDPLYSGFRLNFKPVSWLEIGYGTTLMFDGKGVAGTSFLDYVKGITGFGFGSKNNSNQQAALDMRIDLPFLWNAQLYLEYGGEDSGGTEYPEEYLGFGDVAYLIGIYFPRITADGKTDFRFEFARDAHRVDSTPGFWYGHNTYRSGDTFDQMIIGHHMGPDAQDYFGRVTHYLRNDLRLGLDYEHMERGLTLARSLELTNSTGADVTYDINDRWTVSLRYVFGMVSNHNLIEGSDCEDHLLYTSLKFHF